MSSVTYSWPCFRLVYDLATGSAITHYDNERWSGCSPHADDQLHGDRLRITAAQHRLEHELVHHVMAIARKLPNAETQGCRIIYRDAHHLPQVEPEAADDEHLITTFTYFLHDQGNYDPKALSCLRTAGIAIHKLRAQTLWLLDAVKYGMSVTMSGVAQ